MVAEQKEHFSKLERMEKWKTMEKNGKIERTMERNGKMERNGRNGKEWKGMERNGKEWKRYIIIAKSLRHAGVEGAQGLRFSTVVLFLAKEL